jgi:CubicO group peptidase (beta-lactamase class C family)
MEGLERAARELIENGIAQGWHAGGQICLRHRGEIVLDLALGAACVDEAGTVVPLRVDTLMTWLSASKPVGAVATMLLAERGLLELDDPVALHIPEFGRNGKQAITIRHLLNHTAGFRNAVAINARGQWDDILARCYEAPLEPGWVPGERAGYHPTASWYVLGELIHRISGTPYGEFVHDEIFEPLEMRDCWFGIPAENYAVYVRDQRLSGLGESHPIQPESERRAAETGANEETIDDDPMDALQRNIPILPNAARCRALRPGSNGRGPAREWMKLMIMLGQGGVGANGRRILGDATVAAMRTQQHDLMDKSFKFPVRWGLGLILNSAGRGGRRMMIYGYGPHAGPDTFGHGGMQCSSVFYDPQNDFAGGIAFNGQPGEPLHQRRMHALMGAVYEAAGLA